MPGWADKIDLDRFELNHMGYCVLGQIGLCIYNRCDYTETAKHFLGSGASFGSKIEQEHGFFAAEVPGKESETWQEYERRVDDAWNSLDADWRLAILARQQA